AGCWGARTRGVRRAARPRIRRPRARRARPPPRWSEEARHGMRIRPRPAPRALPRRTGLLVSAVASSGVLQLGPLNGHELFELFQRAAADRANVFVGGPPARSELRGDRVRQTLVIASPLIERGDPQHVLFPLGQAIERIADRR